MPDSKKKPTFSQWVKTRMIHSRDFDSMRGNPNRLTPAEYKTLQKYTFLADEWGYRAGSDGRHTKFERKSHGVSQGRMLQEYTDILFRNLEQNKKVLYDQDTWEKARNVELLSQRESRVVSSIL